MSKLQPVILLIDLSKLLLLLASKSMSVNRMLANFRLHAYNLFLPLKFSLKI
jgi:hypothetical protein